MTKETEKNLRKFMRECQQFWNRQWYVRNGMPIQLSYEQSLYCVPLDMRTVINKPNVHFAVPMGDIITESDVSRAFYAEFSSSFEECKKRYLSGIPLKIITNGDAIFRNQGFDAILEAASKLSAS